MGFAGAIPISVSLMDLNGHAFGPDDPSQKELIVHSDIALDAFFTFLNMTIGLKNVAVAVTGDHGVATTQKAGGTMGMPVLDFPASQFTKPLEQMLASKYPLKEKGKYVLQMDNPYPLLNRSAFKAAGIDEEDAEKIAKAMVKQIFTGFVSKGSDSSGVRQNEPETITHIFTSKQMREGDIPDRQYDYLWRIATHPMSTGLCI